jgi:hypothetical protein
MRLNHPDQRAADQQRDAGTQPHPCDPCIGLCDMCGSLYRTNRLDNLQPSHPTATWRRWTPRGGRVGLSALCPLARVKDWLRLSRAMKADLGDVCREVMHVQRCCQASFCILIRSGSLMWTLEQQNSLVLAISTLLESNAKSEALLYSNVEESGCSRL